MHPQTLPATCTPDSEQLRQEPLGAHLNYFVRGYKNPSKMRTVDAGDQPLGLRVFQVDSRICALGIPTMSHQNRLCF